MVNLRVVIPALLLATFSAQAADGDLQSRVERVERLLESRSLVDMLGRIDSQQREMARMQGELEEVRHQLDALKQRQRELYLDTDRRLSRMEREGVPAAGDAPASTETADVASGEPAPTDVAPVPAAPSTADLAAERRAYQQAFDILRELRYEQAIAAFEAFLTQFPNGRYGHIAQYWLGEANYARQDFEKAIAAYRKLAEQHPNSPKVAEALLKIGYSYHELKQDDKARPVLNELVQRYPDTTEAGQAKGLLKRLGKTAG